MGNCGDELSNDESIGLRDDRTASFDGNALITY